MLDGTEFTHLTVSAPLMALDSFARLIGIEATVLRAQVNRGYWPTIKVGKRLFVNVEAVRVKAAQRGEEFAL